MDKHYKDNFISVSEKVFLMIFFVYAILGSNNITFGNKIITPFMWASFIIGGILILYRVLHIKDYCKMTAFFPGILMTGSIILSTVLNRQYHFKENVIVCIYWVLYFFLLFTISGSAKKERIKGNFWFLGIVFLVYITIGVLFSFYTMYSGVSEKVAVPEANYEYYKGFAIGRLWGIFINPNNSAVAAAVSVAILLYLIEKNKHIVIKVMCIADILLMVFFIALTDSRTGAVSVGVVFGIYAMMNMIYAGIDRQINKKPGYIILVCALTLIVAVAGFAIPRKAKDWYNRIAEAVSSVRQERYIEERYEELYAQGYDENEIEELLKEELKEEVFETDIIDRGYDLSGDVSNRRIDAWKSGTEIFVSSVNVFIYGTSFKGFSEYAIQHIPETYVVNNDYGIFSTMDNEIFNIMTAQGIIGLVALTLMLISLFAGLFKFVFKVKKEDRFFAIMLMAVVFCLAAAAMFSSVMFYHFSQNTIIFWVALGSLMHIVKVSAGQSEVCYEN